MNLLARGAIGIGGGTLAYTVPNGFKTTVRDILISNTTAASKTISLHFVPRGVAVGAGNMFLPAFVIPANDVLSWTGNQALNEGDFIQCIGSASGLTMNISGDVEVRSRLDDIIP